MKKKFDLRHRETLFIENEDTIKTVARNPSTDQLLSVSKDGRNTYDYLDMPLRQLESDYARNMMQPKGSMIMIDNGTGTSHQEQLQINPCLNMRIQRDADLKQLPARLPTTKSLGRLQPKNKLKAKDQVSYQILRNSKNVFANGNKPFASNRLSPNAAYKASLKEKSDRMKYTPFELKQQNRLRKQSFRRENYQSETNFSNQFKNIEIVGFKSDLATKNDNSKKESISTSFGGLPKFAGHKTRQGNFDESFPISGKQGQKEIQQLNVDSINQKIENYEMKMDYDIGLTDKRVSIDSNEYSLMKPMINHTSDKRKSKNEKNKNLYNNLKESSPILVPFEQMPSIEGINRVNTLQLQQEATSTDKYSLKLNSLNMGIIGVGPKMLDIKVESTTPNLKQSSLSTVGFNTKSNSEHIGNETAAEQISIVNQSTLTDSYLKYQQIGGLLDQINIALEKRSKLNSRTQVIQSQFQEAQNPNISHPKIDFTNQSQNNIKFANSIDLMEQTENLPQEIFETESQAQSQAPYSESQQAYGIQASNLDLTSQQEITVKSELFKKSKILSNSISYQRIMKQIPQHHRPKTNQINMRGSGPQQYVSIASSLYNQSCPSQKRMQLRHKNSVSALSKLSGGLGVLRQPQPFQKQMASTFYQNLDQAQKNEEGLTTMNQTNDMSHGRKTEEYLNQIRPGTTAIPTRLPDLQERRRSQMNQSFQIRNLSLQSQGQLKAAGQNFEMSNEAATISSVMQTYQSRKDYSPSRSPDRSKLSLNLSVIHANRSKLDMIKAEKTHQMFWECVDKNKKLLKQGPKDGAADPAAAADNLTTLDPIDSIVQTDEVEKENDSKTKSQKLRNIISNTLKSFGQTESGVIQKWAKPDTEENWKRKNQSKTSLEKQKPSSQSTKKMSKNLTALDKQQIEKKKAMIMKRMMKKLQAAMLRKGQDHDKDEKDENKFVPKKIYSQEMVDKIAQEVAKQGQFYIPPSDYEVDETMQQYKPSQNLEKMNTRAFDIFNQVLKKENDFENENRGNEQQLANVPELLKSQRLQFKNLHFKLSNILVEGGNQAKIKLSQESGDKTEIFVFDKNIPTFAKVDFKEKNLPVTFKIYYKTKGHDDENNKNSSKNTYHPVLPEDLKIYVSMNDNEPGPNAAEMVVENFQQMNQKKINSFTFGSQLTRKTRKFPNRINLCFLTSHQGCVLDVKCMFQKTEKELIENKKKKILDNKAEGKGLTVALELLEPYERAKRVEKIVEQLDDYYKSNVRETDMKKEKERLFNELKPTMIEKSLLNMRTSLRLRQSVDDKLKQKLSKTEDIPLRMRRSLSNGLLINIQEMKAEASDGDSALSTELNDVPNDLSISKLQNLNVGESRILTSPLIRQTLVPRASMLINEETLISVSLAQTMLKQKMDQDEEKVQQLKSRKSVLDSSIRLKNRASLKKWDHFRIERNKYADFVEKLMKDRIRLRFLITLIRQKEFMKRLNNIYVLKREENIKKMNNMFLAIKFYVKFKVCFSYKFGFVQDKRFLNQVRRHLTFRAMLTHKHNGKQAKKIITPMINRHGSGKLFLEKVHGYYGQVVKIQKNIRTLCSMANEFHLKVVTTYLNKEFSDLTTVIQSQKPPNKAFKFWKQKLDKMLETKDEEFSKIGKLYLSKCYIEHSLVRNIFRYLTVERQLAELDKIQSLTDYEDAMETKGVECKNEMKQIRAQLEGQLSKIIEIEYGLYSNTDIVEIELTYNLTGKEEKKDKGKGKSKKKKDQVTAEKDHTTLTPEEKLLLNLFSDTKKISNYIKEHENRLPHSFDHSNLRDDVARAIMAAETNLVTSYRPNLEALNLLVTETEYQEQLKTKQKKIREILGLPTPDCSDEEVEVIEDTQAVKGKVKRAKQVLLTSFEFPSFKPILYTEEMHRLIFNCFNRI